MAVKKCVCEICGETISASNMSKHLRRHEKHPETFQPSVYKLNHDGLVCQFCGSAWKNKNSLCNHERQCKQNPNKQANGSGFILYNQQIKDGVRNVWNKGLTKDTDERVRKGAESNLGKSKPTSDEAKIKISASVTKAYADGRLGKRLHRVKHDRNYYGTYRGFECDSSYELAFVIYNLDHNISISRNHDYFEYMFENKKHKYFPDFIIDNVYYEIKGRVTSKDKAKWQQFPKDKKLVVITGEHIKKYIDYSKNTYGKFIDLYDVDKPSWKDRLNKKYNNNIEG